MVYIDRYSEYSYVCSLYVNMLFFIFHIYPWTPVFSMMEGGEFWEGSHGFIGQWRGVRRQQQSYKGEGGLQKVINFPFHYSFPVVSFFRSSNENDFSMSSYMSFSCRLPSIYDKNDQIHTRFPIYGESIPIFTPGVDYKLDCVFNRVHIFGSHIFGTLGWRKFLVSKDSKIIRRIAVKFLLPYHQKWLR